MICDESSDPSLQDKTMHKESNMCPVGCGILSQDKATNIHISNYAIGDWNRVGYSPARIIMQIMQ